MAIAAGLNTAEEFIVDSTLDNGLPVVVYADSMLGVVIVEVVGNGGSVCYGWSEDSEGTGGYTDNGITVVFSCDDAGGIYITLNGSGFNTQTIAVNSEGVLVAKTHPLTSKPCDSPATCKTCGIYCNETWVDFGLACTNRQACCGYSDCGGTGSGKCCVAGETCKNDPSKAVRCETNS